METYVHTHTHNIHIYIHTQCAYETRRATYIPTSSCEAAVKAIRDHVLQQQGRPLLVTGPPGCGKATAVALFLERYLKELQDDEPDIKALVAGVSTRSLHTSPMDLLRTLMRMIKNFFQLDAPALPEKESEILSHGCLFAWLQQVIVEKDSKYYNKNIK